MNKAQTPTVQLDAVDAIELAETIEFIKDWLVSDDQAKADFVRFVGSPGYDAADLCDDVDRFMFLLGGNDSEHFFNQDQHHVTHTFTT